MNVLVSAIIPVYNAEKFLIECIESLRNQTLSEIEMIFINDGSTDNSLEILREYEKLDSRIIVIDQENKGPSEARNEGIRIAKGEYISFIDADDWIDVEMYQKMITVANKNKSEAVICDAYIVDEDTKRKIRGLGVEKESIEKIEVKKIILQSLISESTYNSMWNKLYKSSIIKDNNILLDNKISYAEDLLFNIEFFSQNIKFVSYLKLPLYYYRRGHNSLSNQYKEDTFEMNGLWLYNQRKKFAQKFNINPFLATGDLYNVLIHCIISEFRRKNIDFYTKKERVYKMLRNLEIDEVINNRTFNLTSKKDHYLFMCIQYKLIKLLYLYVLLGKLKEFFRKEKRDESNTYL